MADDEGFILLLLACNFLSAYYTAFCIEASTKRYHWFHKELHRNDLYWYATWYSCQTIALLVSTTNALLISTMGLHVRALLLKRIAKSFYKSGVDERVTEKEQDHEEHGQTLSTIWTSSSSGHYSHGRQHILPIYNNCPFTPGTARRVLSLRTRQLHAWLNGITAYHLSRWTATALVALGVAAAIWNMGFAPFWITMVDVKRGDRIIMIPWNG
ncbi:hypothetical protein BDZ91DRAFT_789586 [Kalaharituber pfeilii]|nr:hypothetical protein BDZ91DRAFT_789586 [Kalaharituber pfeilii]